MKIAFIGTGNMGAPMARNLLRAGHDTSVYNRTRQKAEPLAADGARVAGSVEEAARDAAAAVTMLANDEAVRGVLPELLASLHPGAIHLGMSTISAALSRELAQAHASARQGYIAAPVLGRPEAAEARKLWIMAAGPADQIDRCRPLLEALGRGISIIGDEPWRANLVKLGANFTLASMLETLGESFALMRKAGVPVQQFLEVLNQLYNSPVYANYGKIIAEEKYEPAGFAMKLGLKDVGLALAAAGAEGVPMPLASLLRDHYLAAIARGGGNRDWSAVALWLAENAGVS